MNSYAGPDSNLSPDGSTIKSFVGWWFQFCIRGRVEIGWLDANSGLLNQFEQFEIGNWDELAVTAVQHNLVPGQSMYFRAATVNARDTFSKASGYTSDTDFVSSPGIWNDIDTQEQFDRAKSVQTMLRPNGSVVTGLTPHMRVQNWFRSSDPIANPDLVRGLNKRLHALYGGDEKVVNPTRLMRLPGTIAWPVKKTRTTPELTTFIRPDPSDPRPASYPLSTITSLLPKEDDAPRQNAKTDNTSGERATLSTTREMMRLIRTGVDWHDNMIRLTAHWVSRGWSDAEIQAACASLTLPGYSEDQTRKEVQTAVDGARRKWGVSEQEHFVGGMPDSEFPDQVIDPWDALQPTQFPIHALPGVLRAYVEAKARAMGADPCAIAWASLAACSSAIDGRTRLRMKRHDTWSVPAPLWVCLVGRSSAKKSPIISDAWRPLEELQNVALRAYADQMVRYNALPKDEKKETQEPPKPIRLLSHDATMESVQDLLSRQDRGIGILRDELSGFIGSMDKYSGGGNGGAADRAFWLTAYNGGNYVVDRVGRGTVPINNLIVSICGGIQPERLKTFKDIADDGLWQRFVPIIIKPSEMGVDEPAGEAVDAYRNRLQGLVESTVATGAAFSDAAHEIRAQIEREIFELEQAEPLGSRFASFTGKLPGLFGRLSLVLSYLEPSGLGYIVSERAASMARSLIINCVIPHAARVYMSMGASDGTGIEDIQAVAGYILAKRVDRLVTSDLGRKVRATFRNMSVQDIHRLLSPLVAGGWLIPEKDGAGNRTWLVNPAVHAKFGNRAVVEEARRLRAREMVNGGDDDE